MFKGHPKGLYIAFFANMGERFGFYTMISIFVLFMQAKYGMSTAAAGFMYSTFMVGVYIFPLLGGFLADRFLGYGKTISLGLIVMFIGYILLALPTAMETGFALIVAALVVISLGTGLFKGNLQALVGNLYDDPKYSGMRDRAFNVFYMGINIGAMFAPTASEAVSNWILKASHLTYDARIPGLANEFLKGKLADASQYLAIAQGQDAAVTMDSLKNFSTNLHQRPEQVLPLRVRRRLHRPDRLDAHLLGLPEILQSRRHDRDPEEEVGRPQGPGRRAHPGPDQGAPRRPRPHLPRRHLLLDGLPPERRDADLLRPRLHRPERRQGDEPVVRPGRAASHLPRRRRPRRPGAQEVRPARPRHRRGGLPRLRPARLFPVQRLCRRQSLHAPAVPALQPVLHRRPDPARHRHLRLAEQEGQGAILAAQDRRRDAHHRRGLCHPRSSARSGWPARKPSAVRSPRPPPRFRSTGSSRPISGSRSPSSSSARSGSPSFRRSPRRNTRA